MDQTPASSTPLPVDSAKAAPPAEAVAPASGPERWVDEHGDCLLRYALARLRDPAKAEDMVQETFLAALRGQSNFAGKSSVRTWLVGILKNKIIDHYRKASRETSFTDMEFFKDEQRESFEQSGPYKDCWNHDLGPVEWHNAGESLDQDAFWKVFHDCRGKLPPSIAQVFLLREVDDVSSEDICQLMNISANNLWVMLHRARMALRRCLEIHWFGKMDAGNP